MNSGTENRDVTDRRKCPRCNRILWFRQCGHTVKPLDPNLEIDPDPPQVYPANEFPDNCSNCDVASLPIRRMMFRLQREIADRRRRSSYLTDRIDQIPEDQLWNWMEQAQRELDDRIQQYSAWEAEERYEMGDLRAKRRGW